MLGDLSSMFILGKFIGRTVRLLGLVFVYNMCIYSYLIW